MRALLVLLLAAALSGCLSDDEPSTGIPDDPSTPIDESDPNAPQPVRHSCTVDVGAPAISISGEANVGGCNLVTLDSDGTVNDASAAEFCTIQFDADGDSLSDGEVVVGSTYGSGTTLIAFCDPPAQDAENWVDLL